METDQDVVELEEEHEKVEEQYHRLEFLSKEERSSYGK